MRAASTISLAMAFSVMGAFYSLSPSRKDAKNASSARASNCGYGEHPGTAGRTWDVGSAMPGPVVPEDWPVGKSGSNRDPRRSSHGLVRASPRIEACSRATTPGMEERDSPKM